LKILLPLVRDALANFNHLLFESEDLEILEGILSVLLLWGLRNLAQYICTLFNLSQSQLNDALKPDPNVALVKDALR
jgi:hypothetical protein